MKSFKEWGLKRRILEDHNYNALWIGSSLKTIRFGEGHADALPYFNKEFYDIAINRRCNAICPFCLVPGTKIKTQNGDKNIEDIKIGDIVKSYNEKTRNFEDKNVLQIYERPINEEIFEIEDDNHNIIRLTSNHKVFTQRGWICAKDLKINDKILNL